MTDPIRLSAPGKLVLFGEYAVLDGHPALVMAVDRRATVELSPAAGGLWSVTAPGVIAAPCQFKLETDGRVRWHGGAAPLDLVDTVIGSLIASGTLTVAELEPFDATLDTRPFFATKGGRRHKLGLGSSAALTVTFASALLGWCLRQHLLHPRQRWLGRLLALHREFQGGRGSGIDLAASLLGGVLRYRLGEGDEPPQADPLALPASLRLVFTWTGHSAATGNFLDHLQERRRKDARRIDAVLDELGALAAAGINALSAGATAHVLELVDAFCNELDRLGKTTGLDILSEPHLQLRRIVAENGGHYKPSGTGGGDLGVVFTDDPDSAAAIANAVRRAGFRCLDLAVDPLGLRSSYGL